MSRTDKAPDGKAWPLPWVAVSTTAAHPFAFGAGGDPVFAREFGGAYATTTCELSAGGYQLYGPDASTGGYAPVDGWVAVERVDHLLSALSAGRAELMATCEKMARFRFKAIIATSTIDGMLDQRGAVPRSARFGSLLSIEMKFGVQVHCVPDFADAEWAAAWILRRAWWQWLAEDASGERLRWVREVVAERGSEAR